MMSLDWILPWQQVSVGRLWFAAHHHDRAASFVHTVNFGEFVLDRVEGNAEVAALHFALRNNLLIDKAGFTGGSANPIPL